MEPSLRVCAEFQIPNSQFQIQKAAPNRETNGGMRRCQRLPEVTHPVDSTRPESCYIKSRACVRATKMAEKLNVAAPRPDRETHG